jgi:hypothetical protein
MQQPFSKESAMKTNLRNRSGFPKAALARRYGIVSALLLVCAAGQQLRADISGPDSMLYGTIAFGTNRITASDTFVTVEARRTNGVLVAHYTMGSRAEAGDYYVLNIPIEELPPLQDPASLLLNEPVSLVLFSGTAVQAERTLTITERGQVQRVDFAVGSTNVPSGFDTWAQAYGLGPNSQNLDPDADGASNWSEYVAGTNPNNSGSRFVLQISETQAGIQVKFPALAAVGTGYEGLVRRYTLERLSNYPAGIWETVPGFSDVSGSNQQVVHEAQVGGAPLFFRAKVSLAGSP